MGMASIFSELIQECVNERRKFDAWDMVYNLAGVSVGIAISWSIEVIWRLRGGEEFIPLDSV